MPVLRADAGPARQRTQEIFTIVRIVACNTSKVYTYRKLEVAFFTPGEHRRVFYQDVWVRPGEANYSSGTQQVRRDGMLQYGQVVISAERRRAGPTLTLPAGTRPCRD